MCKTHTLVTSCYQNFNVSCHFFLQFVLDHISEAHLCLSVSGCGCSSAFFLQAGSDVSKYTAQNGLKNVTTNERLAFVSRADLEQLV